MSIITPESKVEDLRLSQRTTDCLKQAGIVYVNDLMQRAGAELRVFCDQTAWDELQEVLARAGLHIGEPY